MRRRPAAVALHGVILAGLVVGPLAYVAADRTVALTVDGATREVRTYSASVGDLLQDEGLTLAAHDIVTPGRSARLLDGMAVAVLRGRPVRLVVDGRSEELWTTAATVAELTRELGGRLADAYLSVSRSARIPAGGLALQVRLPKPVTLTVGGVAELLVTTEATWTGVLAQAGVVPGPLDVVSVPMSSPVVAGQSVTVTRVRTRLVADDVRVPFGLRYVADTGAYAGTSRVVVAGRAGVVRRTWRYTLHDGRSVQRQLVSRRVLVAAVTRVVAVGTRRRPAPVVRRTSAHALDWPALARCESGGNPQAVGGGGSYFGLYQFSLFTWRAMGGSGNPVDASSAEQTYRAELLYLRSGAGVWPYCGPLLFT